jgi:hypothetical protein
MGRRRSWSSQGSARASSASSSSSKGPVEWQVLANEVWSDTGGDPGELRHRWDAALARLRAKLKESGVRPDLIRSTGAGFVQLVRRPEDVFENRG